MLIGAGIMFPGLWGGQVDYRNWDSDGGLFWGLSGSATYGKDSDAVVMTRSFGTRVRFGWGSRSMVTRTVGYTMVDSPGGPPPPPGYPAPLPACVGFDSKGRCLVRTRFVGGPATGREGTAFYLVGEARTGLTLYEGGAGVAHTMVAFPGTGGKPMMMRMSAEFTYGAGEAGGVRTLLGMDMLQEGGGGFVRWEVGSLLYDAQDVNVGGHRTFVLNIIFGGSFEI